MHAQYRHAAVNNIHPIQRHNVRNSAAAPKVNLAQFRHLEINFFFCKDIADMGDIFRICIVGSGFTPGSCKLVQHKPFSQIGHVLFVKCRCIQGIKGTAYITGQHSAVGQRAPQVKFRPLSQKSKKLRNRILKETALHAGSPNTADFFFTLSQNGVGEGSRRFQRWMMNHQLHKAKDDRMTLLNNWENTYFDFNEEKLVALFGEAKDLGVDLFLLDGGWFGNKYPRKDDHAGLGDWQVTKDKLPQGIPYLVRKAKENGVAFGIWIEPEMVNPKSELAEKHPDWLIQLPSRETYYFRNQMVLDLCNPKVQDFVFGIVDGLMQENPEIRFMKWDCNSPITNIYSPYLKENQGNIYVDYVRGLYKVLDRVQAKYPDLYMMMCSGGGGRSDVTGLRYFTEFWCSDNTDPIERLFIQWGYSHFMPAKAMCAHVTEWNRRASIKFRVDVAFQGKLGFDIGLKGLSDDDRQYCREAIKEYKRLKDVIWSPNLYRLVSPYEGQHCVVQRVDDAKSKSIVFAYDVHPRYGETILPTRLQGLDAEAKYRVKEICLMPGKQSWLPCNDKVYTGDYLMKVGIKVTSTNDLVSHIIEVTKE